MHICWFAGLSSFKTTSLAIRVWRLDNASEFVLYKVSKTDVFLKEVFIDDGFFWYGFIYLIKTASHKSYGCLYVGVDLRGSCSIHSCPQGRGLFRSRHFDGHIEY